MRLTVNNFHEMKQRGERISVLTAYDAPFARALDAGGVDILLVGDSLGNVVLGYENTLPVTMAEMLHHAKAVSRVAKRAFVVFDMPFLSYQTCVEDAVYNAGTALKEAGCHAVKLEGGRSVVPVVQALTDAGIPVMGHLGLTPQSVHQMGGFKVQGRDAAQAKRILEDALALQEAGAFMIVLECVPWKLAKELTKKLRVPTIGIGAGAHCDGQVLVIHDMLNFSGRKPAKFVKIYMDFEKQLQNVARSYVDDVRSGAFPQMDHSFEAESGVVVNLDSAKKRGGRRK